MATVSVRYIVDDVDTAIAFYCGHLGFEKKMHPAPTFAMLTRGDLRLVLSAPSGAGGGGQAMPDGTSPEAGGWNRFMLEVEDLATTATTLRDAGVHFRNDIVTGVGGKQILLDDPSGNPIELFEPTRPEASLSPRELNALRNRRAHLPPRSDAAADLTPAPRSCRVSQAASAAAKPKRRHPVPPNVSHACRRNWTLGIRGRYADVATPGSPGAPRGWRIGRHALAVGIIRFMPTSA